MGILKTYRRYFLFVLVLFFFGSDAYSQTRLKLEEQRKQALLEIEETTRLLKETQQSEKQSLDRLNLLNAQLVQFNRLISNIDEEIAYVDRQIKETSDKMSQMSREIEKMKEEYAGLIHHTYKNKGRYNKLIFLLSANDFNEAYRRMKYFQQYSDFRKKQVADIRIKQEELRVVMELLTEKKAEKEKLLVEQRLENKRLEAVKNDYDKALTQLKSQERKLKAQLEKQQANLKKLHEEISKIITAEAKKGTNTTATNPYDRLTPDQRLVSSNFKGNKGRLPWPVERGNITGYFGTYKHPFLKYVSLDNKGIDITTVGGSDVRAVFDGEVTAVIRIPGANISVLIRHGNYFTVYENLVSVKVKNGDQVKIKETIGKLYTEKGAKTAILHFEILELRNLSATDQLNPELWLGKN